MTGAVYFTGGPESPLFAIYGIEISIVALLTNRGTTVLVGTSAIALYGAMVLLVRSHVFPALPTPATTAGGIPAAELGKIFEAFHQVNATAEREYGGAGLGLSLVKLLVEVMGGEVRVESVEGKGSTFTVTLPRSQTAAVAGK